MELAAVHVAVVYPQRGQRHERVGAPGRVAEPEGVAVEVEADGGSPNALRKHDCSFVVIVFLVV